MRRHQFGPTLVLTLLAAGLTANCGDSLTEVSGPDGRAQAGPTVAFATADNGAGLSITTDKDDYAPGDTVWFTGAGWTPGDTLDIVLTDSTDTHNWTVGIDANGGFRDSTYVVDTGDLGVTFTLTATSRSDSTQTLTVNFTDGQPSTVTVTPILASVPPTGTATYDVAVAMGGNPNACTVNMSVTGGLPGGTTVSFSGNPRVLPAGSGSTNFNSTLSLTPPGATTPGTYTFTVLAARGTGCQGTAGTGPTATGTLIVFGAATHLAFDQQPTDADATVAIAPAVTVLVLDANNNLVANSSASIGMAIATNPGGGTLTGTLPQSAVNGVATFADLKINKAGDNYTLRANSSGLSDATSDAFDIAAGPAAQVVFITQPAGAAPNTAFTNQPVVEVQDAVGNRITTGVGSGTSTTLAIATGTTGAVLTCTANPLGATSGRSTFAGCKIDLAGTGYRLRASTGNLGGGIGVLTVDSDPFDVTASNQPPVLGSIGNKTVAEETQLAFTATATDESVATLVFSLANPATGTFPLGATINGSSGAFTWTPTEAQGPGTYRAKIVVTDAGSLSDEEEIEIAVTEVNLPPVLGAIGPKTVDEMTALTFTATATDPDILAGGAKNGLTFSLVNGTDAVPTGAIINGSSGAFSWTPTEAQGPGVYEFKVRVTDDGTNPAALFDEEEITVTVNEVNRPPVLGSIGNKTVNEGSLLTFTATATDPDIPANTLTFSLETGGNADLASASINPATGAFTWTPTDDNPTGTPSDNYDLKVVVTDNGVNPDNLTDDEQITVTVNNVAPTITGINLDPNTAGYVYPVTSQPKVMAVWSDPGADSHTCTYSIKDMVLNTIVSTGLTCGTAMDAPGAGLYTVQVTVTDDDTGQDVAIFPTDGLLIVIYDPTAGFVTGGGWISSPAGACSYAACTPSTIGKATFGFVSKYLKGATVPTGNTEFQFHAGGLSFKSSSYEWLVVNGNSGRAQYKGVGTVNGGGSFGFILTAYDAATDRFRIKIWDVGTSDIIYDNQMGQLDSGSQATDLGGGSIIIHVPKK